MPGYVLMGKKDIILAKTEEAVAIVRVVCADSCGCAIIRMAKTTKTTRFFSLPVPNSNCSSYLYILEESFLCILGRLFSHWRSRLYLDLVPEHCLFLTTLKQAECPRKIVKKLIHIILVLVAQTVNAHISHLASLGTDMYAIVKYPSCLAYAHST